MIKKLLHSEGDEPVECYTTKDCGGQATNYIYKGDKQFWTYKTRGESGKTVTVLRYKISRDHVEW